MPLPRSGSCSSTSFFTRGKPPKEIVLDPAVTDDPLHRHQEGRFVYGCDDCHCYTKSVPRIRIAMSSAGPSAAAFRSAHTR
jgi:hypothetical protein